MVMAARERKRLMGGKEGQTVTDGKDRNRSKECDREKERESKGERKEN